jgi:hypothetical protein
MKKAGFLEAPNGNRSSNRFIFFFSWLTCLSTFVVALFFGDVERYKMVRDFAGFVLPITSVAKVTQRFAEKEGKEESDTSNE